MNKVKPLNSIWTNEQWQAVTEYGKNILVSAGAGSGKTAVLTERIIEKLKDGISLSNLIVLTFTKAAAFSMKEKIRKRIKEEINAGYDLRNELEFIDQANIQTFDSFALGIVKKYHYILEVSKRITIGDKAILLKAKKDIVDKIFTNLYDDNNEEFITLIKKYCYKNDNNVRKLINKIIQKIELLVDEDEYLNNYNDYFSEEFIKTQIKKYNEMLIEFRDKINRRFIQAERVISSEELIEHLNACKIKMNNLFSSNTYNDFAYLPELDLPRSPKTSTDDKVYLQDAKDDIKKIYKKIKELCIYEDEEEMVKEILATKDDADIIIYILKEYRRLFIEYQNKNNLFDFNGIAKLAIKLVKEYPEVNNEIKQSINEILVDEYQDTSDIQETLISYISNNNVYMVGDVKQSIYRFRNANPKIFSDKYNKYKYEKGFGMTIDLSKNFRSREEVIQGINSIFERVMDLKIGGANYNDGHKLIFGNLNYQINSKENNNLEIFSYEISENCSYKKNEIEAILISKDINKKINESFMVYDGKLKCMRKVKFSDFAVIVSEMKDFDLYKKIFEYYSIPVVMNKEQAFKSSLEIILIKNILKCAYCLINKDYFEKEFTYSLLSILRSFAIRESDKKISKMFSKQYNNIIEGFQIVFPNIYNNITEISLLINETNILEVIDTTVKRFCIYESLIYLEEPLEAEDRVNYLINKVKELLKNGFSCVDFINYLDLLNNEDDLDIEYQTAVANNENAVIIINTHKSKGLEYNICYFCGLSNGFNIRDLDEKIIFDKDLGLVLPIYNEGFKNTFFKEIIKNDNLKETISEKIRLFYVALTRAKEKIIFVLEKLENKDDSLQDAINNIDKINYRSYNDLLSSICKTLDKYTKEIFFSDPFDDYRKSQKSSKEILKVEKKEIIYKEVELKAVKINKEVASKKKNHVLSNKTVKNMEYGTKIHKYFELIDFNNLDSLKEINIDSQIKEKLITFSKLDIFNTNIINSYHELAFSYIDYEDRTINGIIDLLIECNDKYMIIDYKLSDISSDDYIKQLSIYKKYIEKCDSNKSIECYLYSIINNELRKITI